VVLVAGAGASRVTVKVEVGSARVPPAPGPRAALVHSKGEDITIGEDGAEEDTGWGEEERE